MKKVSIGSGTLYPILSRFESAGLLKSEWESIDPTKEGRPRRRLYEISAHGQNSARSALNELSPFDGELRWMS